MNKIKSFFCWLARGFIAISLVIITVLFIRKKKNVITNTYEKETRSQAEDRIRSTPAHAIAAAHRAMPLADQYSAAAIFAHA